MAVKENQKQLYQDIQDEFRFSKAKAPTTNLDMGHGRIETRTCSIVTALEHMENKAKWKNLETIIRVESIREFKNSDKPTEMATRFYISSLKATPEDFQKAIRSHWGIENKLHWTLDVAFSEDASRRGVGMPLKISP